MVKVPYQPSKTVVAFVLKVLELPPGGVGLWLTATSRQRELLLRQNADFLQRHCRGVSKRSRDGVVEFPGGQKFMVRSVGVDLDQIGQSGVKAMSQQVDLVAGYGADELRPQLTRGSNGDGCTRPGGLHRTAGLQQTHEEAVDHAGPDHQGGRVHG